MNSKDASLKSREYRLTLYMLRHLDMWWDEGGDCHLDMANWYRSLIDKL